MEENTNQHVHIVHKQPFNDQDESYDKKKKEFIDFTKGHYSRSFYYRSGEKISSKERPAWQIIKEFKPVSYLKESCKFYWQNKRALKIEILSGMTVSIMQIPESVAFSFVAEVDPISGLYATFFMGFITAAIGGKEGMISGAAGALAVVVKNMMAEDGPLKDHSKDGKFQHLMMTMVLCGLLQMVCGLVQIAKLVKLIPYSAMIGFMNGLGTIIFLSQLQAFTECEGGKKKFQDCKVDDREWLPIDAGRTWMVLFLTFLTMVIMVLYPKIPKIGTMFPSSLVAIIVGTLIEHFINRTVIEKDVRTVGETTSIDGKFPIWDPPSEPKDGYEWGTIINYSISLCFIGLFESVMTLQFLEEITKSLPSQFKANQECFAQGLANLFSGLFGAMGGDAMIGQSCINVKNNGAKGRLSGMIAGFSILIIVVVASPVIEKIPIATLTGVLFMVVLNTFNWNSLVIIFKRKIPIFDSFIIIVVTILAVLTNLAISVVIGVLLISVHHMFQQSEQLDVKIQYAVPSDGDDNQENSEDKKLLEQNTKQEVGDKKIKIYKITGYLHYSTINNFVSKLDPKRDSEVTIIDFNQQHMNDITCIYALNQITKVYKQNGKRLYIDNLTKESESLIKQDFRSQFKEIQIVPENAKSDFFTL